MFSRTSFTKQQRRCCAEWLTSSTVRLNSASYLDSWLRVLEAKLIIRAAAQVQKAADHILGEEPSFDGFFLCNVVNEWKIILNLPRES
jgi:hypothetical protein